MAISTIHGAPPTPPFGSRDDAVQPANQVATGHSTREETENHVNEVSKVHELV